MREPFLTLVSPPATPLLSLSDVRNHVRAPYDDYEHVERLTSFVNQAVDWMDGEAGILGRALITQTWRLTLPIAPRDKFLRLPIPVVQSISGITYFDADNAEQTFASDQYRLVSTDQYGLVELDRGVNWPNLYDRADAMRVEYVTGYGDNSTDVPGAIRQAAMLLVAHWYENREAATEKSFSAMPLGVRALLNNYRLARGFI